MNAQNTDNYSSVIADIFKSEIQIKRVNKEIQYLKQLPKSEYKLTLQNSVKGLKIIVQVTEELLQKSNLQDLNEGRPITFYIYMEEKFPFAFPRIYLKSPVTVPSLADGRDFIDDIIEMPWSPSVLQHEIVKQFTKFLSKVKDNQKDKQFMLNIGKFHLEQEYDIEDQMQLEGVEVFACKELLSNNKFVNRFLQVSNGYIVLFDSGQKQLVTLSSVNQLQDLLNIRRKQQGESTIVLTWKDAKRPEGRIQVVTVDECDSCIDAIVTFMKNSGAKIKKNFSKKIPESEVTLKQYESINIDGIQLEIQLMESKLHENITIQLVNTLMNHYQKAIEFYSAISDPLYEDFIDRLHQLLSRQDVQLVLCSTQPQVQIQEQQEQQQVDEGGSVFDQFQNDQQ